MFDRPLEMYGGVLILSKESLSSARTANAAKSD